MRDSGGRCHSGYYAREKHSSEQLFKRVDGFGECRWRRPQWGTVLQKGLKYHTCTKMSITCDPAAIGARKCKGIGVGTTCRGQRSPANPTYTACSRLHGPGPWSHRKLYEPSCMKRQGPKLQHDQVEEGKRVAQTRYHLLMCGSFTITTENDSGYALRSKPQQVL